MTRSTRATLRGHRGTRLGRSPFGPTIPSIVAALMYGAVALLWLVAGGSLPGGRWLAVHLFTLGILTNLVLAFSHHFGQTLTRQPDNSIGWQTVVVNVGILLVLAGLPSGTTWMLALGATIVTTVVVVSYRRLRQMRKQAVGARFVWIVRLYERAHGAFVHGAILGVLMGLGVLPGSWYLAARTAHLHVNVLGWGGVTLLATMVFFGPTMARTRIIEGADDRAARALRHGTTGLTLGTLLLFLAGVGGVAATVLRIGAALSFAVLAWATTVACLPVAGAVIRRAKPSAARWPVLAFSLWFPLTVWADVIVIATGQWRWLEPVGLAMLVGVLLQAMTAALTYLAPMLRGRDFVGRDRFLARFERFAAARSIAYNAGIGVVGVAVLVGGGVGAVLAPVGWALVATTLVYLLWAGVMPVGIRPDPSTAQPVSQVARRYRTPPGE